MLRQTRWLVGVLAGVLCAGTAYAQTGTQQQTGQTGMGAEQQRKDQGTAPGARQGTNEPATGPSGEPARGGNEAEAAPAQAQSTGTGKGTNLSAAQKTEAERTLAKLHTANQQEIEGGTWMKEHATNDKVKDFANKMVEDHGKMDQEVTDFAKKHEIELTAAAPPPETSKQMSSLKKMEGAQADRTYVRMMVQDHAKDLKEIRAAEQQAKRSGNKDLAKLLDKSAKKVEDHGKDAQKIQRDLTQRQARNPSGQ